MSLGASSNPMVAATRDTIVVGIDFGARSCRVGFATSDCYVDGAVCEWPGLCRSGDDLWMMPSTMYITRDQQEVSIGTAAPGDDSVEVSNLKLLLLHPDQWPDELAKSSSLREATNFLAQHGIGHTRAIAAFLAQLWKNSEPQIMKGLKLSPDAFKKRRMHVVLTVPAMWPGDALQRMREALKESGILQAAGGGTYAFMQETAAGGLYALRVLSTLFDEGLPHKEAHEESTLLLVCDCGGLTADVAVYEVGAPEPGRQGLALHQRTIPETRVFNSDMIKARLEGAFTKAVERFKEKKVPHGHVTALSITRGCRRLGREMMHVRSMNLSSPWVASRYDIQIRDDATSETFQFDDVPLFRYEIEKAYEPLKDVAAMVGRQIQATIETTRRPPDYVYLTGGMAKNELLYEIIKSTVRLPTLVVWTPNSVAMHSLYSIIPQTKQVAVGAVLYGLGLSPIPQPSPPGAGVHAAQASYGIGLSPEPEPRIDWAIPKGHQLSTAMPARHIVAHAAFINTSSSRAAGICVGLKVYCCAESPLAVMPWAPIAAKPFCSITWRRDSVVSDQDDVVLEIRPDAMHDISLSLSCNGLAVDAWAVEVHFYETSLRAPEH